MCDQNIYFINPEARLRPPIEFYSFATYRTTRVATITADGRWILYVQVEQREGGIMLVENFS